MPPFARRVALSAAILCCALPVAAAGRARCPHANTPARAVAARIMRGALLCLVNEQRAAHHLPRLHASALLERSAQAWTDHMVASGVFSHGSNFAGRIGAVGFAWSTAGENIATGYPTPRSVLRAWMASTGHCQNILDPDYADIGIGVAARGVRSWAGGAATWTEDFALPAGRSPPSGNWAPARGCPD